MHVGMARISLVIGQSHSLKDKRMVLRRIKDRVRERVGVVVNEVGEQDIWQRAELGCAVASGDRGKALELLDDVVRCVVSSGGADVVAVARDVQRFDAAPTSFSGSAPVDDRTGAGDKAVANADGDGWVPDAWRTELDKGDS